jgi:hypothetical protein
MRYLFNLTDGQEVIPDEEGIEVCDGQAAVAAAIKTIRELRSEDPSTAHEWPGWRLEITDASGRMIQCIPLDLPFHH